MSSVGFDSNDVGGKLVTPVNDHSRLQLFVHQSRASNIVTLCEVS